jgi:hypothetical protein
MKKLLILLLISTSFSTFADWRLEERIDDFEETKNYFIISDDVKPNKPMSWPHDNAFAFLYFHCQAKLMIMKVTMNNLANDDSYSGDTRYININVKINGVILRNERVQQDFLSDFIKFDKGQTERKLLNAKEVVIQLNHYNQGQRTYSFNMEGLKPLMVNKCSLTEPFTFTSYINSQ